MRYFLNWFIDAVILPYYTISIMFKGSFLIVVFIFILSLTFFFNRGFSYYDEGFILHASQRVLQGEIPYKDFDLIYTPGTVLLTAGAFKLFGESILAGRVLALLVALLTCYLVYTVCYRATKNYLGSLLAVLIYLVWGPTHINFPWPTVFAFSTGLLTVYFLNRSAEVAGGSLDFKKSSLGMTNATFAGIMAFVTFLFKQNFGVAVLLSSCLSFIFIREIRNKKNLSLFFLGWLIVVGIFFVYLVVTDSFVPLLNNIYYYSIRKFLFEDAASTSFPVGVKSFLYLFPGLISVMALAAMRKQSHALSFPLFTLFFYLFGVRPTTDYVHLTSLMAASGIPLAIVASTTQHRFLKKTLLAVFIVLIGVGVYTGIWKNYYRWDSPLIEQKFFISHPRANIFVDRKFSELIPQILKYTSNKSSENDYIFIYPNAPMFYFLSERKNPTRFINLPQGLHTLEQEQDLVRALHDKKVKMILTNEAPTSWHYALISRYILNNFKKKKEFLEFSLWERK